MRTVSDADGNRYLLLKESSESCLVRDPDTGESTHLPADALEAVDGESPLKTAARAIDDDVRRILRSVRDDQSLGLLLEIDQRGPVSVRDLLSNYDLCESDLHGLLAEFRVAGLLEETAVAGERGYQTTPVAADVLSTLSTV